MWPTHGKCQLADSQRATRQGHWQVKDITWHGKCGGLVWLLHKWLILRQVPSRKGQRDVTEGSTPLELHLRAA